MAAVTIATRSLCCSLKSFFRICTASLRLWFLALWKYSSTLTVVSKKKSGGPSNRNTVALPIVFFVKSDTSVSI